MKAKDFFGKIFSVRLWMNLLYMLIVILLLCMGVKFGLDIYTHHGEEISIPDVKHKLIEDATHILEGKELKVVVSDTGYVKTLPADCVLEQSPAAGQKVKSGRVVYVVINSSSSPLLTIPDIIDNCSYREARAKLMAMGFKVGPTEFISGEKDWLYGLKSKGQMLRQGQKVSVNDVIVMQVGDGMRDADGAVMFVDPADYGSAYPDSLMPELPAADAAGNGGTTPTEVDEFEVVTGPDQ